MADKEETQPLSGTNHLNGKPKEKKDCEEEQNDAMLPGPPVPPDGGYGWVILASSFMVNFLVDGVCFSFGIFFVDFLDYFGATRAKTSWIGSVLNGMYLFMGKTLRSESIGVTNRHMYIRACLRICMCIL